MRKHFELLREQAIDELWKKEETKRLEFEKNNTSKHWSWEKQKRREERMRLARLHNHTQARAKLSQMGEEPRIPIMLTFTFAPPYRLEDVPAENGQVAQRILQQAKSLIYHMRTFGKSKMFRQSGVSKECSYKKDNHYEWALELQKKGDVHMHSVLTVPNKINSIIRVIHHVHMLRNNAMSPFLSARDNKKKNESAKMILPLGRTHISIPGKGKEKILRALEKEGHKYIGMQDKEDMSRKNYFFPSLSPLINIYGGHGTVVEFVETPEIEKRYRKLKRYIEKMTRSEAKLADFLSAMHKELSLHNLKSMVADDDSARAVMDLAVFRYLGIRIYGYSQMTFPISLYQKVRKQLKEFNPEYRHLWKVTVDWCNAKVRMEKKNGKAHIYFGNKLIAAEGGM